MIKIKKSITLIVSSSEILYQQWCFFDHLEPTVFISQLKLQETINSELSLSGCKFLYKPLSNLYDNINAIILLNGTIIKNNNYDGSKNNVTVSKKFIDSLLWEYKVVLHLISGYEQIGDYRCHLEIEDHVYLSETTNIHSLPGKITFEIYLNVCSFIGQSVT